MAPVRKGRPQVGLSNGVSTKSVAPTTSNPAATRPRLQSVNQDFSHLDEQLRQVAHIIDLPDDWPAILDEQARQTATRHLVRARAEWVLRWVLDKLADEAEVGQNARKTPAAWQLLDLMIHALPVSRSAPHLRDASLTTILERTLVDNFGDDATRSHDDAHTDSNDEQKPSRKRKRGTPNSPASKPVTTPSSDPEALFVAVRRVLASITNLGPAKHGANETIQIELMKMVLRTESAQAARILRFWLTAVQRLCALESDVPKSEMLDLSLVVEIWESRTVEAADESTSSDVFTTECLIPTLTLLVALQDVQKEDVDRQSARAIENAQRTLEKLLVRHLLAPARTAFFTDTTEIPSDLPLGRDAVVLNNHLHPLRAKYLQAAQLEDNRDIVPTQLSSLFSGAAHLLELAIRASPSSSPKARLAERPWIQAVFVSMVECLGCSLRDAPTWSTTELASNAVEQAVDILYSHNINISSMVLDKLFRYHCGVASPQNVSGRTNWSLIAALIQLDPSTFVFDQRVKSDNETNICLAEVLFEHISKTPPSNEPTSVNNKSSAIIDLEHVQSDGGISNLPSTTRALILNRILIPIISAFAQNRNLLGFIRRWDLQLQTNLQSVERKTPYGRSELIWEDEKLKIALEDLFEQSLTQSQISDLMETHIDRLNRVEEFLGSTGQNFEKHRSEATSSAVIISAVLQAINSDDNINALLPQLHTLTKTYMAWVQDERYDAHIRLDLTWSTLRRLSSMLWPVEIHASPKSQRKLLLPLLEQAARHIPADRSTKKGNRAAFATKAAAMLFSLDACKYLSTVSAPEEPIRNTVRVVIMSLLSKHPELEEFDKMIELFCIHYAHLLGLLEVDEAREALGILLGRLSDLTTGSGSATSSALCEAISEHGQATLHNAYVAALLAILQSQNAAPVQRIAIHAITTMQPSAIARDRRELILNHLTVILADAPPHSPLVLSAMIRLMQVPNASAKLSTHGDMLFDIANILHEHGLESPSTLTYFQRLVTQTLTHLIPNKDQEQNKAYLGAFSKKIDAIIKGKKSCTASRLAILRATILEQKDANILNVKSYIERLEGCLASENTKGKGAPLEAVLDAFNELPMLYVLQPDTFKGLQRWFQSWMKENADLDAYLAITGPSPPELTEYVGRLHTLVAKFRIFPNETWFLNLTLKVVREPLSQNLLSRAFSTVKDTLATLETSQKLDLVSLLTYPKDHNDRAASFRILSDLVSTLPDKLSSDEALKRRQLALLPQLCMLLSEVNEDACFKALVVGIDTILNTKASFVTQYAIECVLGALVKITSRSSPALPSSNAAEIFTHLCETTRLLLLVHRSRLGGRLHLLLPLLQGLLFCLFIPSSSRSGALPSWLRSANNTSPVRLVAHSAAQYTHVLSTLCNPPQSSISRTHQNSRKSKELVDPIKATREKTSGFLYPLLASFCRFQLAGRLDPAVREKLMPGIWDVIGTASLKKEAIDAMFAGLGRSEKDVWRGVWSEWESVRGRKERFVPGQDDA